MTLFAYLAGADVGSRVRLGAFSLTERADGTQGFGSITFDDPDGTLDVRGWMKVVVKETACTTAPVIFSGYVGPRKYSRSGLGVTYKTGSGRFIDTTLVDENVVLDIRLFTGNDAKRPAEDHDDRINWALADGALVGLIDDTSLVDLSDPRPFEEADYKYQYPSNLFEDIASALGRTYFVYVDGLTGDRGLFFDTPDATVGDCTLSISNDLSDITLDANGEVSGNVYPPIVDATQDLDPSEVVAKVVYTYRNGTVTANSATNEATFFEDSGLGYRGIHLENTRVGLESTARRFADGQLVTHGAEKETITCGVIVPKEKAGLIRAGQRIQVKFTHLDGLTSFTWRRITERQITHVDETNEKYLIVLELNNRANGAGGPSGGAPGPDEFPHQPPTGDGHYYEGTMSFNLPSGTGGFGFASFPATGTTTTASNNRSSAAFEAGVTYTGHVQFSGLAGSDAFITAALDSSVIYPPSGAATGFFQGSFTPGAPTWDGTFTVPGPGDTDAWFSAKAQLGGGGTTHDVTVSWWFDPDGWVIEPEQPPLPGQPVGPETVTMTGANGTTSWPFATGSLQVFVDNLDETGAITAQDGATGTFTLGFSPTTTEVVTVFYLGR